MFQGSLSIQLFGFHSPSTCKVQNFQIFTGVFFFILTISTHVSGFTLHTVIWFTLSKHILGLKFTNFHGDHFFMLTLSTHVSRFTLHTVIWFTLSKHMLGSKFSNFHERSFFHAYILHTCFRVHSPYSYLVYTLQAHVRFRILEFSQKFIFFILTLSTHVSGFTLHTVIWFTLSKHMLGSKFLDFHRISFCSYLHSPLIFQSSLSMQLVLHSPSRCYISKFYIVIIISSCA